jgi:hypothetical protein
MGVTLHKYSTQPTGSGTGSDSSRGNIPSLYDSTPEERSAGLYSAFLLLSVRGWLEGDALEGEERLAGSPRWDPLHR